MPTLNLELNYFEHPKARKLRARLGDSADVLPLRLWCYVGQFCNKHDGVLVGHDDLEIEEIIRWKGKAGAAIEALIAVGFLERLPDGILKVHNWEEHSGHLAAFGLRAKAAAKARWDKAAQKGKEVAETTEPEASGTDKPVATPPIQKCSSDAQAMLGDATSNAHAVHAVQALHAEHAQTDRPAATPPQNQTPKRLGFTKPTLPEIQAYIADKGYSVDAEAFLAHYTSNGWKVGSNPMKDWRAAVVTWHKKQKGGQYGTGTREVGSAATVPGKYAHLGKD